jgi:uncharacterized caspase-like protein
MQLRRRDGQGHQRRRSALFLATVLLAAIAALGQNQAQRGFAQVAEPDQAQYQNGGYYALIIGIRKYQAPLSSLATPVHDAQDVAAVLTEQYGFHVQLLLDGDATRNNILTALDRYRNTLRPNDSLLIYYAGHGYYDHDADRAYWLPADADSADSPNHISADDITAAVRVLPSMHVLVVSDSCYSGDLTRDAGEALRAEGRPEVIARMLRSRSRNLMTSGGDEPVSDGGPDGHSVFAYAFLSALREEHDESFTATDLFYGPVQQEVAGSSQQTPRYSILRNSNHEYGDFVFTQRAPDSARAAAPEAVTEPSVGMTATAMIAAALAQNNAQVNTASQPQAPPPSDSRAQFLESLSHPALGDPGDNSRSPANPDAGDTSNAGGAASSVVIPGHGFDPYSGGSPHGFMGKITVGIGGDAQVTYGQGMLNFFHLDWNSNRTPAADATGRPVEPVSCQKLSFQNSHISAVDQTGAMIPNYRALKISGRTGEATLYLSAGVIQQAEDGLRNLCSEGNQ